MINDIIITLLFVDAPANGGHVSNATVSLQEGTTLGALIKSDVMQKFLLAANVKEASATFGVWGRVRAPDYVMRANDRLEVYRPLKADPKDARRAKVVTSRSR